MNTHIICASPVSSINTHAQQCIGVHPMTTGTNKDIPKVSGMTVPTIVSTAQGSKKARIQCTSTRTAKGKNHYIDLFRCLAYNTYCNRVRLQWMRFRMDSALSGLQPKPNPRTSENRSSKLDIEWNITKFVIEQEGNFLAWFEPAADMAYVETCVKALL